MKRIHLTALNLPEVTKHKSPRFAAVYLCPADLPGKNRLKIHRFQAEFFRNEKAKFKIIQFQAFSILPI